MSEKVTCDRRIYLGMPGYGQVTPAAAKGFWRATRNPESVHFQYFEGSLLARNFNALWCTALNMQRRGQPVSYFAMQHADVEPEDFWLDTMIGLLEKGGLDVLGAVVPIKDGNGTTSLAIDSGNNWRPKCRLTMTEAFALPETFTSEDVGGPLLINTGLWVCRFDSEWNDKLHFEINDRIVFDRRTQSYRAECEPEDWFFSRLCHELNLKVGATRRVKLIHRGWAMFPNIGPWGYPYDREYVDRSQLPEDRRGEYYQKIQGYFDFENFYSDLADALPENGRFVEVGCWRGQSLAYLLTELGRRNKRVEVYGVDHFRGALGDMALEHMAKLNDIEADCRANLARIGYPFEIVAKPSTEAAAEFEDRSLDAVFIDGSHDRESVVADLRAWMPKVKPGGILCGHDYDQSGVHAAVAEVLPSASIEQRPRPESMGGVRWGVCWQTRL